MVVELNESDVMFLIVLLGEAIEELQQAREFYDPKKTAVAERLGRRMTRLEAQLLNGVRPSSGRAAIQSAEDKPQ